jgi:hypothetical protein
MTEWNVILFILYSIYFETAKLKINPLIAKKVVINN